MTLGTVQALANQEVIVDGGRIAASRSKIQRAVGDLHDFAADKNAPFLVHVQK
jgi:hypothetical protein